MHGVLCTTLHSAGLLAAQILRLTGFRAAQRLRSTGLRAAINPHPSGLQDAHILRRPTNSVQEANGLEQDKAKRMERIKAKTQQLQDLLLQVI